MSTKRKADCTPEEWQKLLEKRRDYHREYAKKHRKHKEDYTEGEWNDILKRRREKAKHKEDYTEEDWQKYLAKKRQHRNSEYSREWQKNNKEKCRLYTKKWQSNNKEKRKEYEKINKEKRNEYFKKYINSKVLYLKYAHNLTIDEDPIADKDGFLMVRDFHTKEYFYPTRIQVIDRISSLFGKTGGECHLYKSNTSKKACPVFGQKTWMKGIKRIRDLDKARSPAWRDMVISRADGHCERCGKKCDSLIAHHKVPVASCAMMAADIDNGMALCPECHREVHSTDGCRLHELAAEKRKTA
jgi:hypothetical protein